MFGEQHAVVRTSAATAAYVKSGPTFACRGRPADRRIFLTDTPAWTSAISPDRGVVSSRRRGQRNVHMDYCHRERCDLGRSAAHVGDRKKPERAFTPSVLAGIRREHLRLSSGS